MPNGSYDYFVKPSLKRIHREESYLSGIQSTLGLLVMLLTNMMSARLIYFPVIVSFEKEKSLARKRLSP